MSDLRRSTSAFATLVLILAACGGGGGGTTTVAPTDAAASSGPTQATTSDAPAAPTAPGGGSVGDVCGLITPEELAGVFNVPSVKTTVFPGPPDTCAANGDDGTALTAWVMSRFQSGSVEASVWESMMSDPSAIAVSGIGDKAAHVQNTGFLVLKGDALLSIGLMTGVGDLSEDEQRQLAEKLGAIAAGRM